MGDDDRELKTKTVDLGGEMTLRIPADWTCGRLEDGRWRCGDEEGYESVYLETNVLGLEESAARPVTPTSNAIPYVEQIRAFLREHAVEEEIEVTPIPSGRMIRATTEHSEDGKPFRHFRWYVVKGYSDCVGLFRQAIVIALPVRDEARLQRLIEHFHNEAHAVRMSPSAANGGEETLQDLSLDGVVTLRVPARWQTRPEAEMWFCHDPDGRPGRMWANYDLFEFRDPSRKLTAKDTAEAFSANWPSEGKTLLHRVIAEAPLGAILYVIEEDGLVGPTQSADHPPVRYFIWQYVMAIPDRGVVASFNLMIPIHLASTAESRQLVALIEREIRALRLGEHVARR